MTLRNSSHHFFSLFLIYLFIWSTSQYVSCSFLWIEPFSSYLSSDTQQQAIHLNRCLPCFAPYDGFRTELFRKGKGRRGKATEKRPFCLFLFVYWVCNRVIHLCSCIPKDRGAWRAIVHRVTKSQTRHVHQWDSQQHHSVTWHSPGGSARALWSCFLEHISKWPFLNGGLFEMMNLLKNVLPIGLK